LAAYGNGFGFVGPGFFILVFLYMYFYLYMVGINWLIHHNKVFTVIHEGWLNKQTNKQKTQLTIHSAMNFD